MRLNTEVPNRISQSQKPYFIPTQKSEKVTIIFGRFKYYPYLCSTKVKLNAQ